MSEVKGKSRLFPPVPYLLGFVFGLVCDGLWPWPIAPYKYVLPVGVLLGALGAACALTLMRTFKRHETSPDPYKETTAIVDTGLFRFSRNPIYITLAIFQTALGLVFNNMWVLLMIIPALIVIHYVVVLGEEVYLEAKFGGAYLDYKSRVRRWI